jgi:hypothetical protein
MFNNISFLDWGGSESVCPSSIWHSASDWSVCLILKVTDFNMVNKTTTGKSQINKQRLFNLNCLFFCKHLCPCNVHTWLYGAAAGCVRQLIYTWNYKRTEISNFLSVCLLQCHKIWFILAMKIVFIICRKMYVLSVYVNYHSVTHFYNKLLYHFWLYKYMEGVAYRFHLFKRQIY